MPLGKWRRDSRRDVCRAGVCPSDCRSRNPVGFVLLTRRKPLFQALNCRVNSPPEPSVARPRHDLATGGPLRAELRQKSGGGRLADRSHVRNITTAARVRAERTARRRRCAPCRFGVRPTVVSGYHPTSPRKCRAIRILNPTKKGRRLVADVWHTKRPDHPVPKSLQGRRQRRQRHPCGRSNRGVSPQLLIGVTLGLRPRRGAEMFLAMQQIAHHSANMPEAGWHQVRDEVVRGLVLRVGAQGQKVWELIVPDEETASGRPKRTRSRLGIFPDVSVMDARRAAEAIKADRLRPGASRGIKTVGDVFDHYANAVDEQRRAFRDVEPVWPDQPHLSGPGLIVSAWSVSGPLGGCFPGRVAGMPARCAA